MRILILLLAVFSNSLLAADFREVLSDNITKSVYRWTGGGEDISVSITHTITVTDEQPLAKTVFTEVDGVWSAHMTISGPLDDMIHNTIPHEADHIARKCLTNFRLAPRWLDEGCATYAESEAWKAKMDLLSAECNTDFKIEYLDKIEYDSYEIDYVLGYSLVKYMIADRGEKILFAFYRDARKPTEKFQDYYGISSEEYLKRWKACRANPQ